MRRSEVGLVIFASISTFFYCGAFYGWGPLQLLLEQNGNFHQRCDANVYSDNEVCEAQTSALLNVRMISQTTVLGSPILGLLVDRRGPTPLAGLMTFFAVVGLCTMMVAVSKPGQADFLLYLSMMCLGFTASAGTQLTVQSGLVFVDSNRRRCNRVISGLNSIYDAGAVTFLFLWASQQWFENVTLLQLVLGYLVLAVFSLGGYTYCFWAVTKLAQMESAVDVGYIAAQAEKDSQTHKTALDGTTRTQDISSESMPLATVPPTDVHSSEPDLEMEEEKPLAQSTKHGGTSLQQTETMVDPNTLSGGDDSSKMGEELYIPIAQRPVSQQLRSLPYVTLCLFHGFHVTANVWALTTARDFLKYLGDDEHNNRYLTIFTLLTPISLLALPFVDVAMHRYGFHSALQAVNVLALAHGLVKVTSSSLKMQILGFIFSSFFGCFLFSVSLSCLASFLSKDGMGRGMGVFHVVAGLFSLVNIPLAKMAVERLEGDFFIPNLIFVVLLIPVTYCTWLTGVGLKRNRQHHH